MGTSQRLKLSSEDLGKFSRNHTSSSSRMAAYISGRDDGKFGAKLRGKLAIILAVLKAGLSGKKEMSVVMK